VVSGQLCYTVWRLNLRDITIDLPWVPVQGTEERSIVHKRTGQVLHFTDDVYAPEQEPPIMGLADLMAMEDIQPMKKQYTKYELFSGGY